MCTHLTKRDNRYYIRRKIPVDLQAHYGRKEIVKSLGTSDRAKAIALCRKEDVALDNEFAAARAQLGAPAPSTDTGTAAAPAPVVEEVNADEVAGRTLAALRQRRDAAALNGPEALAGFMENQRRQLTYNEDILAGDDEPWRSLATHEGWRNGLRAFLTGDGSVVATAPASRPTPNGKTSLEELAQRWNNERKPQADTFAKTMRAVRHFIRLIGDLPVEQITRRHMIEFKDRFLEEPGIKKGTVQTPVNTNAQIEQLSTVLNYGRNNAVIDTNPAQGIRVDDTRTAKERIPLDLATMKRLFSCPIYTKGQRTKGGAGEAQYWLPLLALFTGARIEELCQLSPDDVLEEPYFALNETESVAWVIRITDAGEDQGVKNAGSVRRVPVHPALIELGFIEHAKQAAGRARIFNELIPDPYGRDSGNWSSWFNNYLRTKVGVSDPRMVFHGFRHTFKDAARNCEIEEAVSDALTGHSSGKVGRKYGSSNYPLRPLVEAIQRYRIPGLVLPAPANEPKENR